MREHAIIAGRRTGKTAELKAALQVWRMLNPDTAVAIVTKGGKVITSSSAEEDAKIWARLGR